MIQNTFERSARKEGPVTRLRLSFYKKLFLIRRSEEFIIKYYSQQDMKTPMHMSMGQEAIAVGVCHALADGDQVFATYRSHAVFLAKTCDTDQFFGEMYGKVTGCARGKAGSMHLAAPEKGLMCTSAVVASGLPVAVGAAFAHKRKKNGLIACTFFGDGAVDEGVFWESLNLACVTKVPVLFVCEDNGLAVHTHRESRHGFRSIPDIVSQFRCSVFQSDSTDVEVIHELARAAVGSIKETGWPSFLHLKCYRYLEHVGIADDFSEGYRSREEFEEWNSRDCVAVLRDKLLKDGVSERYLMRMEEQIEEQIEQSIRQAKRAPFPTSEELFQGVFHEKD